MYGKFTLFTNPLYTTDYFTHAQTVCTKPFLGEEGPEDEATMVVVSVSLLLFHMSGCLDEVCD